MRFLLDMSVAIGSMLIIHHVHYTLDVVVAYAIAHLLFKAGVWLADKTVPYSRYDAASCRRSVV